MRQVLPWESISGPVYHDCPAKQQPRWVKPGGWVLVVGLLVGGMVTRFRIALVFSVLYAITLVTQRDTVVTSRGLEIFFDMRITTQYYFWKWKELFSVTYEDFPANRDVTVLYFTKDDRTKKLFFPMKYRDAILELAREENPDIHIYDAAETKAKAEQAKARKAEARKTAPKKRK